MTYKSSFQKGNGAGLDANSAQMINNLASKVTTQKNVVQNVGPVGQSDIQPMINLGPIVPITLIADNSGSSTASTYKIGDPGNIMQTVLGLTITDWAATSTWQNTQLQEYARYGFVITQFNYQTDGAATQFAQTFNYASVDAGRSYSVKPLNTSITASQRNTQQNTLLQTINFPQGLVFLTGSIAYLVVEASSTVTLTCSYAAVLQ